MSNQRIVLASNNAGKVREINQLLEQSGIEVLPQAQFDIEDAVE
ncbi:MAG: non-canonical purine NTP pyrophosphatase, partial [Gammaproteobacteria bacterium]|nr:non-canonical purine NTP pyrophosphatase [Gammaproteobacteria bacterium]